MRCIRKSQTPPQTDFESSECSRLLAPQQRHLSAVGCSVILKCRSRRRPWLNTTSTNTRKVAVGTVKKSNAIRSWARFFRNVRHTCDGGLRCRGM